MQATHGTPNDLGPYYDKVSTSTNTSTSTSTNTSASASSRSDEGLRGGDKDHSQRLGYWLGLSDFYTFKDVILFDNWGHLVELLASTDLEQVLATQRSSCL